MPNLSVSWAPPHKFKNNMFQKRKTTNKYRVQQTRVPRKPREQAKWPPSKSSIHSLQIFCTYCPCFAYVLYDSYACMKGSLSLITFSSVWWNCGPSIFQNCAVVFRPSDKATYFSHTAPLQHTHTEYPEIHVRWHMIQDEKGPAEALVVTQYLHLKVAQRHQHVVKHENMLKASRNVAN